MVIKIETDTQTIKSIDKPTDIATTPDNRVELVKTVKGVIVNDGWSGLRQGSIGDTTTVTVTMDGESFKTLQTIVNARTKCTVTIGNMVITGAIVVIRSYTYSTDFPDYYKLGIDVWKVN